MTFNFFNTLYSHTNFDEIKIIGKDLEKEGHFYHVIGMTLKDRQASLYVLEFLNQELEKTYAPEKTRREQLKSSISSQADRSFFMSIKEFRNNGLVFETAGTSAGPIKNSDYCEAYMLFMKMYQAGWKIPETSPFYKAQWEQLAITHIELRDEMDKLPEWTDSMQVLTSTIPIENLIEQPVMLEVGRKNEIEFALADGSKATCFINNVYTMDVWADEEKKFADSDYRERMLQHMSEEEFESMKKHFFDVLIQDCPKGKHFMVAEYECTSNVSLRFYDKEYLDTCEKPKEGSASTIFIGARPDVSTGEHDLKMRACVIQKPLEPDVKKIEAELFSYAEILKEKVERI